MSKIGIFIFRRDLRLYDNLGLINLQKEVDVIIPIFILDKYQIKKSDHNQYYHSNNVVQFMCESLIDLNESLSEYSSYLRLYYGNPSKIVDKIIKILKSKHNKENIYLSYNADYSRYSIKRDNEINDIVHKNDINLLITENDYTLIPFDQMLKGDGTGFKQYGAFYKNAIKHKVNKPIKMKFSFIKKKKKMEIDLSKFYKLNPNIAQNGGRSLALDKLDSLRLLKDYNENRDYLSYETSHISAYLNFGCISIREVYYKIKEVLGNKSVLIKQLYWRDFFLQALRYLPDGNSYHHMDSRYDDIKWTNSKKLWLKLINSETGFLIIDAAMREMIETGYMHNRARMIVGIFWTKFLLINIFHPIYGSQVGFSKYLVDAIGPSQNKLNHQWITEFDYPGKKYAPSTSKIAGRPMDPSNRMISKFDPECEYIKKWLPHLSNVPNKEIIKWNDVIAEKYNNIHPAPIFDHKIKYKEWIDLCDNKNF